MKKYNNPDFIGKEFGYLTVIGIEHSEELKQYLWRCRCRCGKEVIVTPYRLVVTKEIKSCGCYKESSKTGLSRKEYHRKYIKEYRDLLKSHNLCVRCKKKDAWTMIGHRECFECNQKRRKTPFQLIKEGKEDVPKIPKPEWNSYGLCCKCGKNPIKEGIRPYANVPYKVCEECYQHCLKMREAYKEKYESYGIRYIYPPHVKTKRAMEVYQKLLNDQKERKMMYEADKEQTAC